MFIFENLEVYKKAVDHANKIHRTTRTISKEYDYIKNQIRRSSSSIPLNIAEGNGRFSKKDRRNMFVIARGSCFECVAALELLKNYELISSSEHKMLLKELEDIGKMLSGLIRNCS